MRHILCFGDSNTWGYRPDTHKRFPWGVRWTSILQEKCDKDIRVIEEGLVGRTTVFEDALRPNRNGSGTLPLILETYDSLDVIVIMLGTNDCKSYFKASSQVIGKGIEVLLNQIEKKSPTSKVLLVSPIYLGEDVWHDEFDPEFDSNSVRTSKELKEVYSSIAKKRGISFIAASDYAFPSSFDHEHMDSEGHKKLAEGIYDRIQEIINEKVF